VIWSAQLDNIHHLHHDISPIYPIKREVKAIMTIRLTALTAQIPRRSAYLALASTAVLRAHRQSSTGLIRAFCSNRGFSHHSVCGLQKFANSSGFTHFPNILYLEKL
jgi:hypothetical protein